MRGRMPAMKSFYGISRKNDKLQGGGCGGEGGRGKIYKALCIRSGAC